MFRRTFVHTALILSGVLAGCGSDDVTAPRSSSPYGLWRVDDGLFLPAVMFDLGVEPVSLQLNESGSSQIVVRSSTDPATSCFRVLTLLRDGMLTLDFSRVPGFQGAPAELLTASFPVVEVGETTLTLVDDKGLIHRLSRFDSIPEAASCDELVVVETFAVPEPSGSSGMARIGDVLYYRGRADLERFDLATDSILDPVYYFGRHVQTSQGGTLWSHCGCGGNHDATRRDLDGTRVDDFDTEDDFDHAVTIGSMAHSPALGALWVHGYQGSGSRRSMLIVDVDSEPDVLLNSYRFDHRVTAMDFEGDQLWMIAEPGNHALLRVDPLTGVVLESHPLPDVGPFPRWVGLIVREEFIHALVAVEQQGLLLRIERPTSE